MRHMPGAALDAARSSIDHLEKTRQDGVYLLQKAQKQMVEDRGPNTLITRPFMTLFNLFRKEGIAQDPGYAALQPVCHEISLLPIRGGAI